MSEQEYKITSVSKAIKWAKQEVLSKYLTHHKNNFSEQPPIHVWYRGHKKECYELVPDVFRDAVKTEKETYEEGGMLLHLMKRLPLYHDNCPSTFDSLSLSRHYELPCRLIDWTENVLIALWFAVDENEKKEDSDARIFALNARELSRHTEFKHFQRNELAVYSPDTFNVILRSELALTAYLDDLLCKTSVRTAAQSVGFSNDFWESLINMIAHTSETHIKTIESINDINKVDIPSSDIPSDFLPKDQFETSFIDLHTKMPKWLQEDYEKNIQAPDVARKWLFNFLFSLRKPVAVFPERRNIRITAQSGMFVLSGGDYLPKKCVRKFSKYSDCRNPKPIHLQNWLKDETVIKTAIIPNKNKKDIREELEMIGIHAANLFPDFDKQAKYIKEYWKVDLHSN